MGGKRSQFHSPGENAAVLDGAGREGKTPSAAIASHSYGFSVVPLGDLGRWGWPEAE